MGIAVLPEANSSSEAIRAPARALPPAAVVVLVVDCCCWARTCSGGFCAMMARRGAVEWKREKEDMARSVGEGERGWFSVGVLVK